MQIQKISLMAFWLICSSQVLGQVVLTDASPRGLVPSLTNRVVLTGKEFKEPLRVRTSIPSTIKIDKLEPTKVAVEIQFEQHVSLGPVGLWVATDDGPSEPLTFLVDDLPTQQELENHGSIESAQGVEIGQAIEGSSSGPQSDFYRFHAKASERVAFDLIAQRMGSSMDGIVRLLNGRGELLYQGDDDSIGPDVRFSYTFKTEGDYFLEVRDNKFASGGRYRLRIGDFPLVPHPFPLAVNPSQSTKMTFDCLDGAPSFHADFQSPKTAQAESISMSIVRPEGKNSGWTSILLKDFPLHVEHEGGDLMRIHSIPFGFSGRLLRSQEKDRIQLVGKKGETIRIQSRTRSVGSAALLRMQLTDASGKKVAETAVTDADEWGFDHTFSEDGDYQLEVEDILGRGGIGFGYYVEVTPGQSFAVAIKADAKTKDRFLIEEGAGACAIDLQIARNGYDGPIKLSIADGKGLRIVNPLIPAKAKDFKVYLSAEDGWLKDSFVTMKLEAAATEGTKIHIPVSTQSLRRLRVPHVPFPDAWVEGVIPIASAPSGKPFFAMDSSSVVQFAKQIKQHTASVPLKRLEKDFKDAVTLLPTGSLDEWSLSMKADKDNYTISATRSGKGSTLPESLPLLVYGEFKNRGRIETIQIPVQWINPIQIAIPERENLLPGQSKKIQVKIVREGTDRQPVILKWKELPKGLKGPNPLEVPADGLEVSMEIAAASDLTVGESFKVSVEASSQFTAQSIQVSSNELVLGVAEPPTKMEVFPQVVKLDGPKDRQQILITGLYKQELPRDWTHEAAIVSADESVVRVVGSSLIASGNGATEVVIRVGELTAKIPVTVTNFDKPRRTEFENEVLVALSKQGCNSGACHGSPSGKGNFRLSLRAFDQKLDQLTLIREDFGRRVNTLDADQSLLLLKPLMKVSHGGGLQLRKQDPSYEVLRDWIAEGAQSDPSGTARCVKLELTPGTKRMLKRNPGKQQVAVTAVYSDGRRRDVTRLVAYESSNTSVATVDAEGLVTAHQRGEAAILVRYLEHIESVTLMFIEDIAGFVWKDRPSNNYVDQLVYSKLKQLQYLPSETCSDSEFLRRVHLDVIGILPTVEESEAFLNDDNPSKRRALVDRLLERPEFAKFWALKWGDLLKLTSKGIGDDGVHKYYRWVEQAFLENMPYDEFARTLLTSSGSTLVNPPANFYRTSADMNDCVETISQVFLGARLQCAKCHNHPFERWTQDNYYGLGAFFQRVQRKKMQRPGELFVWTSSSGEVTQPRTGETMKPWLPLKGSIDVPSDSDRRLPFAEWLISKENPYFAKIEVNRIWSQLFSRGIVEPIDDFRDSNPPSNDVLLEALAKDFSEHGFDRKHILRTILNSRTYQASFQTNEFNRDDTRYFSHQEPRLLSAEQLLDAVNQATGTTQTFGNLPPNTKATHLPAPDIVKVDFLKVFGQPERSTVCACERTEDSNLGMAIELFNGPLIYEKLRKADNRFRKLISAGKSKDDVIRDLYLAALCRLPTEAELSTALAHCNTRSEPLSGLEDVCWALLNTDEFLFQH